jgi:hypothetical protein
MKALNTLAAYLFDWMGKECNVSQEDVDNAKQKFGSVSLDANKPANKHANKPVKESKKKCDDELLPFLGVVNTECCASLVYNHGLYTQCSASMPSNGLMDKICTGCVKKTNPVKYGTVVERMRVDLDKYVTPQNKKVTNYGEFMAQKHPETDIVQLWTQNGLDVNMYPVYFPKPNAITSAVASVVSAVSAIASFVSPVRTPPMSLIHPDQLGQDDDDDDLFQSPIQTPSSTKSTHVPSVKTPVPSVKTPVPATKRAYVKRAEKAVKEKKADKPVKEKVAKGKGKNAVVANEDPNATTIMQDEIKYILDKKTNRVYNYDSHRVGDDEHIGHYMSGKIEFLSTSDSDNE